MSIPGYPIQRELGRGSRSIVYLAVQEALGRPVALKVWAPSWLRDPGLKAQFLKAGRALAELNHSHIVPLYEVGYLADQLFIVMEYVPGGTLSEKLRAGWSFSRSIQTAKEIAEALAYAHRRGIVHGNIKPSNILFRSEDQALLSDFRVVETAAGESSLTAPSMTFSTLRYLSPEQVRGEAVDARSDLYSFGLLFYDMLMVEGVKGEGAHATTPLVDLTASLPGLPRERAFLQPVLDRLLTKDPKRRFADARQFIQALEETLANYQGASKRANGPALADRPRPIRTENERRRQAGSRVGIRRWVGWGSVFVIVGAVAGFLLQSFPKPPLDSETPQSVQQLFRHADRQMAAGHLIEPKSDNAMETYFAVLEIAPENEAALTGLRDIADRLERLAQAKQRDGDVNGCLTLIEQGLRADPQHAGLRSLQQTVMDQMVPGSRQHQIAQWLAEARAQILALHLTAPAGDNAFDTYQRVLRVDPNNEQARLGLEEVATRIEQLARLEWEEGQSARSLLRLKLGLRAFPENQRLMALHEEILAEQERERR